MLMNLNAGLKGKPVSQFVWCEPPRVVQSRIHSTKGIWEMEKKVVNFESTSVGSIWNSHLYSRRLLDHQQDSVKQRQTCLSKSTLQRFYALVWVDWPDRGYCQTKAREVNRFYLLNNLALSWARKKHFHPLNFISFWIIWETVSSSVANVYLLMLFHLLDCLEVWQFMIQSLKYVFPRWWERFLISFPGSKHPTPTVDTEDSRFSKDRALDS